MLCEDLCLLGVGKRAPAARNMLLRSCPAAQQTAIVHSRPESHGTILGLLDFFPTRGWAEIDPEITQEPINVRPGQAFQQICQEVLLAGLSKDHPVDRERPSERGEPTNISA